MEDDYFFKKYGALMTLTDLALMLDRSYDGLRTSLRRRSELYDAINDARVRMGRRVYFSTAKIAAIIRNR
jgi:hypothetical protein